MDLANLTVGRFRLLTTIQECVSIRIVMKINEQIIIGKNGKPVSVVLNMRDYQKLLSLLSDVLDRRYIARHRKDSKKSFSEFMKEFEQNHLV